VAAILAVCAAVAMGLVALVVSQSQPARAAGSMGEFTFASGSGKLTDPDHPFGTALATPAACPDYEVNGEKIPIDYTLELLVAQPGGAFGQLLGPITSATPYDAAKTASLNKDDNPGMVISDPKAAFASDGTYELRLVCLDEFGGENPDGNYWTQKITVTGDDWVVGEGAQATQTEVTAAPPVVEPGKETVLTATVSPAGAAGTVTFLEGATTLGEATVASGKAELKTSTLAEGTHSITARFTPANTAQWGASESTPFDVTVQLPRYEMRDDSGKLLPFNPELKRGQTVSVLIRGCTPGTSYAMSMFHDDTTFPAAEADQSGTATWARLTVPDEAVAGQTSWVYSPQCTGGRNAVQQVDFTIGEPSSSESPTATPTDDPTDGPSGDPTDTPTGDTAGTTDGGTGGDGTGGSGSSGSTGDSGSGSVSGSASASGGTSPQGGLASTGSQVALFSGIGAVVLVAAGVLFVRFGRRGRLLNFGEPRA
jgi:hypothetical protein